MLGKLCLVWAVVVASMAAASVMLAAVWAAVIGGGYVLARLFGGG